MPFLKKHPWLSSLTLLLVLFVSLLPVALKYGAIHVLEKQSGQQASIADIDLNLFTGHLQIRNIKLQNEQYSTQIKQFDANILLRALFQKRLLFSQIKLSGVALPIEVMQQAEQQRFKIAGFEIPQSDDSQESSTAGLPIDFGVRQLSLHDINLQLIQNQQQQLYQIRNLSLNELYSWDSDFARLKLTSALNKKTINANLQVHLFAKVPKIIGTIKVRELELNDLQEWVQQPLAGQLSADMTFTLEQQSNGINLYQYSDISLKDANITLPQQQIGGQELTWQGDIHYFAGDVQGIKVLGKLNGKQLAYSQGSVEENTLKLLTDIQGNIDLIGHLDGPDAKIQQNGLVSLANFTLQQVNPQPNPSDLTINYQKFSYQGQVNYQISQPKLNLDGSLHLEKLQLAQSQAVKNQQHDLQIEYPQVRYQGVVDYDFEQQNIALDGNLSGEKLQLTQLNKIDQKLQNNLELTLNALNLTGSQQIQLGEALRINAKSDVSFKQLALTQQDNSAEQPSKLTLNSSVNGKLNLKADFAENQQNLSQTGSIAIKNLAFTQNDMAVNTPAINWNGKINWQQTKELKLTAKGDLNGQQLQFKQQTAEAPLQLTQSLQAQLDLLLTNNAKQLQLQQQGSVHITDLNLQQQGLSQLAKLVRYDGNLNLTQTHPSDEKAENGTQDIDLQGKLTLNQAQTELPDSKLSIAHNLSSDFALKTTIANDLLQTDYQGSGQISAFRFSNQQQTARFKRFNWNGKTQFTQNLAQSEQQPKLSGQLKLNATQIQAGSPKLGNAVQLDGFNLASLTLKGLEHFAFRNLELNNLDVQGVQGTEKVPVATIKSITLNQGDITVAPQLAVELDNIAIVDFGSELNVDKNYQVTQVDALLNAFGIEKQTPNKTTDKDAEAKPEGTPSNDLPKILLGSFALQGTNQIQLKIANPVDEKAPPITKTLAIKTLQFDSFDSTNPEQASNFEFLASLDEFNEIRSSGKIAPLANQLSVQAKTTIDGLALNDFSPLVQQAVGYQIDSGQLSAKIDSNIADNKIDMENDVKLYKFELASANKEKTDEFNKSFSMPLEVGLSLLRDKNDNIELKLPIKGDLSNPNFSIEDVVATALNGALGKATRTYLLLALQPFGAIALVGEMAFDQLSAVRLQPVAFEDGSFKISDEMQTYLQKVSTLLKSKSNVQIKLCGGANQSDKKKIAESAQTDTQKKEGVLPLVTDDQLLRLAGMRQTMIKRYLLEQGVSTNQIVICQPKISTESGAAKIQMGI